MKAQQKALTYVCPVEEIYRKTGNVYTSIIRKTKVSKSGSIEK